MSANGSTAKRFVIVTAVVVVALVIVVVIADIIFRNIAQDRIASEIESNLPENVSADVTVNIGGFSMIGQYLAGTYEKIELDAPDALVSGVHVNARVEATDIPLDMAQHVGSATGTVTIPAEDIENRVALPGNAAEIALGDGTVSYSDSTSFLGISVGYTVTAVPTAAGKYVHLEPSDASLDVASGQLDVSGLLESLVGSEPVEVCVAQYLPDGVDVSGIDVSSKQVTLTFSSESLVLSADALASTGSCP